MTSNKELLELYETKKQVITKKKLILEKRKYYNYYLDKDNPDVIDRLTVLDRLKKYYAAKNLDLLSNRERKMESKINRLKQHTK